MKERTEYGGSRNGKHGRDESQRAQRERRRDSSPTARRNRSRSPTVNDQKRNWRRNCGDQELTRRYSDSRARRQPSSRHQLPPRPSAKDIDNDPSIDVSNYTEYRRQKRQKMAQLKQWLIWGRSPSPIDEPLLGTANEPQGEQPLPTDIRDAETDPAEAECDQEELRIFMDWLWRYKSAISEQEEKQRKHEEESRPVGPAPPPVARLDDPSAYGINLRPGEGERMAEFARQGQRIPRRGEVGLTSEQIETFEEIGYVMSGSRHSRMNAIRIRKENQVYTAEEKAALAMFNQEEAKRKEQQLTDQFKQLIQDTIGEAGGDASASGGHDRGVQTGGRP